MTGPMPGRTGQARYSEPGPEFERASSFIVKTLLPGLGIADQFMPKSRKVRGPPSGEP
jgi:hypothetical protein